MVSTNDTFGGLKISTSPALRGLFGGALISESGEEFSKP